MIKYLETNNDIDFSKIEGYKPQYNKVEILGEPEIQEKIQIEEPEIQQEEEPEVEEIKPDKTNWSDIRSVIIDNEGFVPVAKSSFNEPHATVGYGFFNVLPDGRKVFPGMTITKEESNKQLDIAIDKLSNHIQTSLNKYNLQTSPEQLNVLIDLGYHAGAGTVDKLLKESNGDSNKIGSLLLRYATKAKYGDKSITNSLKNRALRRSQAWNKYILKGKNGLKLPKYQNSGKLSFWSRLANQLQSAPSNGETTIAAHNADLNRQVEQARKEAKSKGENPDRAEEEVYKRGLRTNGAIVGGAALGAIAPAVAETVKFATKTPVGKKALQKVMKETAVSMAGGTAVDALSDKMTGMSFGRYVAGAIPGARNLYDHSAIARFGIDVLNPGYLGLSGSKALLTSIDNAANNTVEHIAPIQIKRIQKNLANTFGKESEITTAEKIPVKWKHTWNNNPQYQNNVITSRLWTDPSLTAHEFGHHVSANYQGLSKGNIMGAYTPGYIYGINTTPEREAAENFADIFRTRIGYSYKGKDPSHILRQKTITNNLGETQYYDVVDPGAVSGKEIKITPETAKSITDAEWNSAYNAAVESGNIAEAQRLRDLHFLSKAPDSKILSENGMPKEVYHGSRDKNFTIFDSSKTRPDYDYGTSTNMFTDNKTVGLGYAENDEAGLRSVYLNLKNTAEKDFRGNSWNGSVEHTGKYQIMPLYDKTYSSKHEAEEALQKLLDEYYPDPTKQAEQRHYIRIFELGDNPHPENSTNAFSDQIAKDPTLDGGVARNVKDYYDLPRQEDNPKLYEELTTPHTDYFVKDPRNIKSSAAITYDDTGKIIPLSKRDNFSNPDIRYGIIPLSILGGSTILNLNKKPNS